MRTYIVKSGDTLASIAKQFYNDLSKYEVIAKANNLTNPNSIRIGQRLQIPDVRTTASATAALNIDAGRFQLPVTEYNAITCSKQMIVLHFTAGLTAESAHNTFKSSPSRVATPYVVDRDGTIYELFPPQFWALHLFRHKKGEFPLYYQLEKCTVPIEIVNVGPLKPDRHNPDQLNWWPPASTVTGQPTFSTRWSMKSETDKYVSKNDRGVEYFAAFTEAQYDSLNLLVDYLCDRFDIPKQAPADKLKTDLEGLANYHGIVSHQHFREDKWDVGPAFDWGRIGL